MRWSYKTVHFSLKKDGILGSAFLDEEEIEISLNEYGYAGWELVSFMEVNDGVIGVFKMEMSLQSVAGDDGDREDLSLKGTNSTGSAKLTEERVTPPVATTAELPVQDLVKPVEEQNDSNGEESDVGSIRIF